MVLLAWSGPGSAAPSVPQGASGEGAIDEGNPRVEARLLVDADQVRAGGPLRVGVHFELDRAWHMYWRNPGQAGLPTELDWSLEGAEVGPIQWPAPHVFEESDGFITTYGYDDEVLLFSEAVVADATPGERELRVDVRFLVCRVRCIPGNLSLRRVVRVGDERRDAPQAVRSLFDETAESLPVEPEALGLELEALYSQSAVRPGDSFRAGIAVLACQRGDATECGAHAPGTRDPTHAFVPDSTPGVELEVTGTRPHPFEASSFLVTLSGLAANEAPEARGDQRLRGVLAVHTPDRGVRHVEVDLPLPRSEAGAEIIALQNPWLEPVASATVVIPFWQALVFALVGGLVLNLMPCVLPVLAIKVAGVAELAHRSRREVRASGAAYLAGILVSMLALSGTVVGLRAAGTSVGWGFQFQEPLFVVAISAVLLVFALNLFGVFEIQFTGGRLAQLGAGGTGTRRSFFEGLLAVIVATPCSAPFLGTAVGFAFASATPVIVAIFCAIGLGLAAPYVLITLVPGWARLVPRTGMWMVHLRHGLGFALLATIVWLLWVVGRTSGVDGVSGLLAFLVALAFSAWLYGAFQSAGLPRVALAAGVPFAALAVAGIPFLPLDAPSPVAQADENGVAMRSFDPAAIEAELGHGRAVFVYFTADWCITCKMNERVVLRDTRVRQELERLQVSTFKADWTRRDDVIRRELARHGRAGVPMYLLYDPDAPASPVVLPELLTVDGLIEALRLAAPQPSGETSTPIRFEREARRP